MLIAYPTISPSKLHEFYPHPIPMVLRWFFTWWTFILWSHCGRIPAPVGRWAQSQSHFSISIHIYIQYIYIYSIYIYTYMCIHMHSSIFIDTIYIYTMPRVSELPDSFPTDAGFLPSPVALDHPQLVFRTCLRLGLSTNDLEQGAGPLRCWRRCRGRMGMGRTKFHRLTFQVRWSQAGKSWHIYNG